MSEREVLRCVGCQLVQFVSCDEKCRRCHKSLRPEPEPVAEPVIEAPKAEVGWPQAPSYKHLHGIEQKMAQVLRVARLAAGLSQREMGDRIKAPRTYISKMECGGATPTLNSINRLAVALGVRLSFLMLMLEGALEE